MAPEEGFEPPTRRLTAACSTTELLRNIGARPREFSTHPPQGQRAPRPGAGFRRIYKGCVQGSRADGFCLAAQRPRRDDKHTARGHDSSRGGVGHGDRVVQLRSRRSMAEADGGSSCARTTWLVGNTFRSSASNKTRRLPAATAARVPGRVEPEQNVAISILFGGERCFWPFERPFPSKPTS